MKRCTIPRNSPRVMGSILSTMSFWGRKTGASFFSCSSLFFDFRDIYRYGTRPGALRELWKTSSGKYIINRRQRAYEGSPRTKAKGASTASVGPIPTVRTKMMGILSLLLFQPSALRSGAGKAWRGVRVWFSRFRGNSTAVYVNLTPLDSGQRLGTPSEGFFAADRYFFTAQSVPQSPPLLLELASGNICRAVSSPRPYPGASLTPSTNRDDARFFRIALSTVRAESSQRDAGGVGRGLDRFCWSALLRHRRGLRLSLAVEALAVR